MEASKELAEKVLETVETAKSSGKIKKGVNEATKAAERGTAKLIVVAKDVNPPEVIMHLEPLCQEKGIPYVVVPNRNELGSAVGLTVPASAVALIEEGDAKKLLKEVTESIKENETAKG